MRWGGFDVRRLLAETLALFFERFVGYNDIDDFATL
jgi:hypothetical protein